MRTEGARFLLDPGINIDQEEWVCFIFQKRMHRKLQEQLFMCTNCTKDAVAALDFRTDQKLENPRSRLHHPPNNERVSTKTHEKTALFCEHMPRHQFPKCPRPNLMKATRIFCFDHTQLPTPVTQVGKAESDDDADLVLLSSTTTTPTSSPSKLVTKLSSIPEHGRHKFCGQKVRVFY